MLKKICYLTCLFALTVCPLSLAADSAKPVATDTEVKEGFWTATFGSGQYLVALSQICSVAKQTYVLDNNLIIREVSIDTRGSALARFYYIEPIVSGSNTQIGANVQQRASQLAESAAARAGANTGGLDKDTIVIKQYPTTSHAKTIEYRVASPQDLDALYSSVTKAWKLGRGRSFTCQ